MNSVATPGPKVSATSAASFNRQTIAMLAMALGVLVIAVYLPVLHNGFVNYDDPDYITQNSHVLQGLNWQNIQWAFGRDNPAANWHPFTWISHMLDVQLFGLNPSGHHLVNLLLRAVDAVILFLFLVYATQKVWQSAAVVSLFAVHPLNVESVAWASERKQELSFFFLFLALLAYVRYVKNPGYGRYLMVTSLFICALLSKVTSIIFPVALLPLDYWPFERFYPAQGVTAKTIFSAFLSSLKEKIPLFCLSIAAALFTMGIHRKEGTLTAVMPLTWRLKNAVYCYAVYLWKAVWPTRLAVFYPHPENRLPLWQVALSALVLVVVSALVWKFREKRYLTFGWLWYLGTAFPMVGVVQAGRQGMANRFEDFPLLGVYIAVVWLAAELLVKRRVSQTVTAAGFALILLPLILVTHRQIGYWKDSITLFTHAVEVTSYNGTAENNLGAAYMENNNPAAAYPHFAVAVQYEPSLGSAHYNLGVILQRQGQLQQAAEQYRLAITYAGDMQEAAQAHNNLGVILLTVNNLAAAKSEFDKAIALNPGEVNSYIARGTIAYQFGKIDDAIADFIQACSLSRSPVAYFWLGRAYETKGDFAHAKSAYQIALEIAPQMQEARSRLQSLQTLAGQ